MVTLCRFFLFCFLAVGTAQAEKIIKSHGYCYFKGIPLKYPADFKHFEYVNPNAPKGGTLRLAAPGTFDSLNPFILKGTPDNYISTFTQVSLMTQQSHDERFTQYCLAAESIEVPEDKSWVIFNLRPEAQFHDGTPLRAQDVVFTFHTVKEKGLPHLRSYFQNVRKVEALTPLRVKFTFGETGNMEMPGIVGQMPILSKKYYDTVDFTKTTLEAPLGSGPYRVVSVTPGKRVVYERIKNWWGENLPVRKGQYNFDRVQVEYYRDSTVAFEAFKAHQYDYHADGSAKNWHTGYHFPAAQKGWVQKRAFPHESPTALTGFFFNTRRDLFQDRRVREAISLAFDFEWTNKHIFYNAYQRLRSTFTNTGFSADALPTPGELKILEPYKDKIPGEVFTTVYAPAQSDGSGFDRKNLIKAAALLKEAGYEIRDNRAVHAKTGKPLEFQLFTSSASYAAVSQAFAANLARLGITMRVRLLDEAQFEWRAENFDFDMIILFINPIMSPGNEQRSNWSSAAADQKGSSNIAGVKNPVIDDLVEKVIGATNYQDLLIYARALDRVILWNHYVIPLWTPGKYNIAYWNKFSYPKIQPKYAGVGLLTWWYDDKKAKALERALKEEH